MQSYVDLDTGPGALDYGCGTATYEGHDGTDFRLPSARQAAQGVAVLAAHAGTVKGVRDGMTDQLVTDGNRASVAQRECGNGVVLDHGDGWETQYCHMRRGSVGVKPGETVAAGARLGEIGYSGLAQFAHLHLTVRHQGRPIDPFSARAQDGSCLKDPTAAKGLWRSDVAAKLVYANSMLLGFGLTGAKPAFETIEIDDAVTPFSRQSEIVLVYARFTNLRQGDRVRLRLDGPEGLAIDNEGAPLESNKASYVAFAGKRRSGDAWPAGDYAGAVEVVRAGAVVLRQPIRHSLPAGP